MYTEINSFIDSLCCPKQSQKSGEKSRPNFLLSYSSYSFFCSFVIVQTRQLLGKLIKDLDNEGNSSILWTALCCVKVWSQSSSCQLLLSFGWLQLPVYVAELFSRGTFMIVSTLYISIWSSVCFSCICTDLYFYNMKSHLRKSNSASTSFLIYSINSLTSPYQCFKQQSSWPTPQLDSVPTI